VWKEKFEKLEAEYLSYRATTEEFTLNHKTLIEAHDGLALRVGELQSLAKMIVAYFGDAKIPEMLDGDIQLRDFARKVLEKSPSGASPLPLRADEDESEGAAGESAAVPGAVTGAADARSALGTAAPGPLNGEYPPHMPSQYYDAIYEFVKRRASKDLDGLNRPAQYDLNFIYQEVKMRAAQDPGILELLTRRPELCVTVERPTIEVNGDTLRGALAVLLTRKFFDKPQNGNSAFNELKRLGRAVAKPNVYRELDKLAELGFVTKEETGYQAVPGMKVQIVESGKAAAAR
jgi:hypothetical protein